MNILFGCTAVEYENMGQVASHFSTSHSSFVMNFPLVEFDCSHCYPSVSDRVQGRENSNRSGVKSGSGPDGDDEGNRRSGQMPAGVVV